MGVISQNGIDYPVPSVPVQSDGSATDLTNAAVPTGQTIKSYINSNLRANADTTFFTSALFTNTYSNGRYLSLQLSVKSGATGLLSGLSMVQINFTNSGIQLETKSSTTGEWTTVWSK